MISFRRLGLASVAALALGAAACSDKADPLAPGLGVAEAGNLSGSITTTGNTAVSSQIVANRSGTMVARVCGPTSSNYDVLVTSGTATDTVATATTTGVCENVTFPVQSGRTYRLRITAVTGTGNYTGCYAYEGTPEGTACLALPEPGTSGQALIDALAAQVRNQTGFLYDSARGYLYQDVEDPDDDNVIFDLYFGKQATVARRSDATMYNAEHTWPQSCGARLDTPQGPRGDLNIIFASDPDANNRRSNHPYGVVVNATYTSPADPQGQTSKLGTNAQGITVFEPRASKKGDIARAIFYYYVRYVTTDPTHASLENFNIEEPVLLQWSQQDPPDAAERARDDEVFKVQHNRNPFIAHPEYVTQIGDFPNTVTGTHAQCDF